MFLDTAKATLIFKGVENPALQPAILNFIERISQVKIDANSNFDTIEEVIHYIAMPFYERKNDLEDTYFRIEQEKAKRVVDTNFIEILTQSTEELKAKMVGHAKKFLDFNFVDVRKNPVRGQNVISLVDLMGIQDSTVDFYLYQKKFEDFRTQKIPCSDVIYDCFYTKKKFEEELKNKDVLPKRLVKEIKAETKFTEDMSMYFLASR